MFKQLREFENFHIVLWLLKDLCWVSDWKIAGMVMIIPTLFMALYITWRSRKDTADIYHNIAVCCWICANGTWMTGEFFFNDTWRPFALVFFLAGIAVVTFYYALRHKRA